ncbi:MAG: Crp/Fnr family transcriptional regulator [Candidatus Phosphoribacter sp.]|nr:Crp/Fnr family transcriptional regulator [Actinomycetales bacterium]
MAQVVAREGVERAAVTRQLFEMLAGRPLPGWKAFAKTVDTMAFAAGEPLYERETDHPYVYVILSGAVKILAVNPRGTESLVGLGRPGEFVGSLRALAPAGLDGLVDVDMRGKTWMAGSALGRTDSSAVAVTDCVVERLDYRIVQKRMRKRVEWAIAVFHTAVHYGLTEEGRARELLMYTAEERYRNFRVNYPDLLGVLPQKDIGSYIGVTPVGISRIATRVRAQQASTNGAAR